MSSSSSTSSDSNIYIATADSNDYLINPIDWNNITTHGVKDNSIPGSKIISIPVSKIVGDLPGGASKADVDAANLSTSNITAWQKKLQIDTLDALVDTKQDKLTAGTNITISGNTISSTGTKYTAGTNISISDTNAISVSGLSKSSVGLGNVDNTSDANKPISTATQTALSTKQDKQDNSLKTTSKTVVGAINENFDKVQNINNVTSGFTGFNGMIYSESIMTDTIMPYKIASDGSIPIQIETVQSTGNINHNGNICFGNKYYEPLDNELNYKVNTNGALGWYVWKRVFIDENGTEILPEYITITNVKLKYATGRVLTSNNISIKFSDWQYFQKAFNNKSVVINATRTIADGRSNYVVKYYQLSSALKVTKVGDLYQFTYDGVSYTVTHVSNYKFKATSTVDPSIEVECVAQVKTLAELVNDATFAVIVPNTTSSDGAYTINFSMATSDDHFSDGTVNITSNNGKSTSDANFIPTLNWNANTTAVTINKCKLYLSNKQATITQFTDNELPEQNLPNLFENLDNYTEVLGSFSYTQKAHYTGNLIHESHEYKDGYNTMILEYQPQRFGDSSNTNIVNLFSGEYGDEDNNIRSWDTSLRVTTNPELGCVQIFNFSYAEGFGTVAAGGAAHAEGKGCKTYEDFSHVEGSNNVNIGYGAHVEGWNNTNFGYSAHAEGRNNLCTANHGHVEGQYNTVNGDAAHAEGYATIAASPMQHVQGMYNVADDQRKYADIIGWGSGDTNRKNIQTTDIYGNFRTAGSIEVSDDSNITTNQVKCWYYWGKKAISDSPNEYYLWLGNAQRSYKQIKDREAMADWNINQPTTLSSISVGDILSIYNGDFYANSLEVTQIYKDDITTGSKGIVLRVKKPDGSDIDINNVLNIKKVEEGTTPATTTDDKLPKEKYQYAVINTTLTDGKLSKLLDGETLLTLPSNIFGNDNISYGRNIIFGNNNTVNEDSLIVIGNGVNVYEDEDEAVEIVQKNVEVGGGATVIDKNGYIYTNGVRVKSPNAGFQAYTLISEGNINIAQDDNVVDITPTSITFNGDNLLDKIAALEARIAALEAKAQ